MFNTRLNTVTGPTKSVVDTGPLIDATTTAIQGVHQTAEAGIGIVKGIKTKKKQKAKEAQAQADRQRLHARQDATDERAETTFANTQADRAEAKIDDLFQDAAASSLRQLSKTQSAIAQGVLPQTSLRLETEKAVTSLLTEFPSHSSELNKHFKDAGLSHLVLGDLQDQQSRHESEREAREAARADAVKTAYARGLATDTTPEHQAVTIGQQVQTIEALNAQLHEKQRILNENRRLSIQEREVQQADIDRQLFKTSVEASGKTAAYVTAGFINQVTAVDTPEQFSDLVKQAPSILAKLEEERFNMHELSGFNKDAIRQIDSQFDGRRDFINKMTTGDLSFAKQQATQLTNLTTNAKLSLLEANPALATIGALPKSLQDPIFNQVGVHIAGDPRLTDGMADLVTGITSEAAEYYKVVTDDNILATDPDITPEQAKGKMKKDKFIHDSTLVKTAFGEADTEGVHEFVGSQARMLGAYDSVVSTTQESGSRMAKGADTLFKPMVVQALDRAIANPDTRFRATQTMLGSRKLAHKGIMSLQSNSQTKTNDPWKMEYNKSRGVFEARFDREQSRLNTVRGNLAADSFVAALSPASRQTISEEELDLNETSRNIPKATLRNIETLNTSLEFIVRTREHGNEFTTNAPDSLYREAYATGDFGILFPKRASTEQEAPKDDAISQYLNNLNKSIEPSEEIEEEKPAEEDLKEKETE